jgi:predicted nucleic acid-binding protein
VSELIVADAGPLIGLAQIGLLPLLKNLYTKILIPPKVHSELQIPSRRPGYEPLAAALDAAWISVEAPQLTADFAQIRAILGESGEAEAVALAEQRHTDLLIDEKRGRSVALSRGLQIVGTGAVLLLAKERGMIDRVTDALDQLASHSIGSRRASGPGFFKKPAKPELQSRSGASVPGIFMGDCGLAVEHRKAALAFAGPETLFLVRVVFGDDVSNDQGDGSPLDLGAALQPIGEISVHNRRDAWALGRHATPPIPG